MTSTDQVRILIAASGSGGHLVPALAIARAIKSQAPEARIEFVGSDRPLEAKLIDAAGFRRHIISTVGLRRTGLHGALNFFWHLPSAFIQVWRLVGSFKPQVIIGVGGYVTFLPVTVGWLRGVPTWIHEAELKPGTANFVLAHYATKTSIAFKEAKMPRPGRVVFTGHPIRAEIAALAGKLPPKELIRRLLILGGSQGAEELDRTVPELSDFLKACGLEVWHQTRPENIARVKEAYTKAGLKHRVVGFIDHMPEAYRWADIIISRAGAGSVMELGVVNIPVIFVPFPYAQGDHQIANAEVLVRQGKALLVKEGPNFKAELEVALKKLLEPENYRAMRDCPFSERSVDAATKIAAGALALVSG